VFPPLLIIGRQLGLFIDPSNRSSGKLAIRLDFAGFAPDFGRLGNYRLVNLTQGVEQCFVFDLTRRAALVALCFCRHGNGPPAGKSPSETLLPNHHHKVPGYLERRYARRALEQDATGHLMADPVMQPFTKDLRPHST